VGLIGVNAFILGGMGRPHNLPYFWFPFPIPIPKGRKARDAERAIFGNNKMVRSKAERTLPG